MAGRAVPADLLVPLARETDELAPRKRARRHALVAAESPDRCRKASTYHRLVGPQPSNMMQLST